MEETLSQLVKEASKPKHASVCKLCQEALDVLSDRDVAAAAATYQLRERCLVALQQALESNSSKLSSLAVVGMQNMLVDERFQSSMESEEQCHWLPVQVLNAVHNTATLPDGTQVDVMKLLLNMAVTSSWCMNAAVIISIAKLCFASLLAAPRTNLRNVVVSLFLRVLHSFAENVLSFASTHEVLTESYSSSGPYSIRTAVKAAFIQLLTVFVEKLADVFRRKQSASHDVVVVAEFANDSTVAEAAALSTDFIIILRYLCEDLAASRTADQAEPLLLEGILILLHGAPPSVTKSTDFHDIIWQLLCPSLIQIVANPVVDKTLSARCTVNDDVGRGSGCSAAPPNIAGCSAKAIYGIAVELVQSVGRYSSLCPVIESLFHRIFLYHAPMHRLEAIKSVQPLLSSPQGLLTLAGPLIDDDSSKPVATPGGPKQKRDADLALLKLIVDCLQECCHCNETSVVITSIDLINDLLTSLDQLINSDVTLLPFDSSLTNSSPADTDIGEVSCDDETTQQLVDSHTDDADDGGNADDDDVDADVYADDDEAGRHSSELEVKQDVADADTVTCDSRREFDVAERQLAALYVSRLSQFIATLVTNATSSVDADKLLQNFSSTFCTELLARGPETVVLNADAVYVTTYSVLHLTMTLHRSEYFTSTEKSLPLSEQQFIDDVLNTGLLLYASRTWLSEVFHLVIIKDLFTSVVTADTQVLNTLLSEIDGSEFEQEEPVTSVENGKSVAVSVSHSWTSLAPGVVRFGRRVLTSCWEAVLDVLSVLTSGRSCCGVTSSLAAAVMFNARDENRRIRQAICTSLSGLQKAGRLSGELGLYDRCGSVFEHLATASCSTELDEPRRPALSQTSSQSQHLAAAAADRKTSPASVISSVLGSRPKLARLHAAHALSMDVLLSMALEMGFHTHTCWKHVFRCCAHIAELEHAYFSCGDNPMSLPDLHPDAMRPLPMTSTSDPDDLESSDDAELYSSVAASAEPHVPPVSVQQLIQQSSAEAGWDNTVVGGGLLSSSQASKVMSRLAHEVDRLFEEAPVKLSLRSLVGFLTELCEFSHQQLSHHSRQLSIIGHTQTQTAPHTTLLLYRLGDIMSRSIATDRPHLHLMRVWSVAAPHFVEAACHRDAQVSKKAVACIHDSVTSVVASYSELPQFHFNEALCKPFENLLCLELCDGDVQDQVVCSICELVEACTSNIRSGWKPLFGALRAVRIEYTANEEVNESRQQHVAAVLDVFNVFLATDNVVVFANAAVDCILCLLKYVRGPGSFEVKDLDDSSDSESGSSTGFVDGQDLCLPALSYLRQCCEMIASMSRMPACPVFTGAQRIHVAGLRPADMSVYHDVDLETFHRWFAVDHSQTDEESTSSLQSPSHGSVKSVDAPVMSDEVKKTDGVIGADVVETVETGAEELNNVFDSSHQQLRRQRSTDDYVESHTEDCVASHHVTSILEECQQMFEMDRSGCLRVYFLVIEGLTETVSSCPKHYQPQTLDVLFALMRSASKIPGPQFALHCVGSLLLPTLQAWLRRPITSMNTACWDSTTVANFKHYAGLCVDLVVELVVQFTGDVSLQHVVETILHQQLCVLVDCISQPYEAVSRLGCSCIRHCLLHCGPVMTESMWWVASEAVRRAFNVTLYPLRQLMTPFHSSSENFYGDVGQVKVAVRQDATLTDCVRLQQLARQVFQLDSQYVAGGAQSTDDNKSYVFLFYSPQPQPSTTATTTATQDSLLIARVPYQNVVVGLMSNQLLIQCVCALLLRGSQHTVPAEQGIITDSSAAGTSTVDDGDSVSLLTSSPPLPGMLGYMSSRVVFALLDCLQLSHDSAMQFDARPGLKFLVQKVSRFDVAANLYRQAGIARTVYTHVLLELSIRLDDLSVHKIRQVLAQTETGQDKCDTNDLSSTVNTLMMAEKSTDSVMKFLPSVVQLLKLTYDDTSSRYVELFLDREGSDNMADKLSDQTLLVFLVDDADVLPTHRLHRQDTQDADADQAESQPPRSHKPALKDRVYTVATDRTIRNVMAEYRRRKLTRLLPRSTSATANKPRSVRRKDSRSSKFTDTAGKLTRSRSMSACCDPVDRQIVEQERASIMKDGEAHLRSSVETLCNMLQLVDELTDREFHAMLPLLFSAVVQLMAHCRDRQLRESLARWTYRVGLIFEFAASADCLTSAGKC